MTQNAETAKKTRKERKKKKEKKKKWRCSLGKTRPRQTQAAARPRSQRDPGRMWPLFLFFFFFFFSDEHIFFTRFFFFFFLLWWTHILLWWTHIFCCCGFLLLLSLRFCLFFYFSCKSSLRDSISMQIPRLKNATLDVNNP